MLGGEYNFQYRQHTCLDNITQLTFSGKQMKLNFIQHSKSSIIFLELPDTERTVRTALLKSGVTCQGILFLLNSGLGRFRLDQKL